jgi:hypothetical protein
MLTRISPAFFDSCGLRILLQYQHQKKWVNTKIKKRWLLIEDAANILA